MSNNDYTAVNSLPASDTTTEAGKKRAYSAPQATVISLAANTHGIGTNASDGGGGTKNGS